MHGARRVAKRTVRLPPRVGAGRSTWPEAGWQRDPRSQPVRPYRCLCDSQCYALTKVALQHLKRQGRRTGCVPYGYRLVDGWQKLDKTDPARKVLYADSAEQAVVEAAKGYRQAGMRLRAIAAALTEAGHRSRAGTPFGSAQIMRMVA